MLSKRGALYNRRRAAVLAIEGESKADYTTNTADGARALARGPR